MNDLNSLLQNRRPQLARPYVLASSIETSVGTTTNTSIELPEEIDSLIDNKAYRNRYKKLIREGHLTDLLQLAVLARERATEQPPSHWFARVCSVKQWERTMAFLTKLRNVQATAERVARRLHTTVSRFIYQQVWRGANVERWAALAEESGRSPVKYFAWLCQRGDSLDLITPSCPTT